MNFLKDVYEGEKEGGKYHGQGKLSYGVSDNSCNECVSVITVLFIGWQDIHRKLGKW
jgi:hypothetical protein